MTDFSGQWIGRNIGKNAGIIILELDKVGDHISGHFYLFENDTTAAGTMGEIRFPYGQLPAQIEVNVLPFNAHWGRKVSPQEFEKEFPDYTFPTHARIQLKYDNSKISVAWQSNIDTDGNGTLRKGNDRAESLVDPVEDVNDWTSFKNFVGSLDSENLVFRGQPSPWPLRTSFHRTTRSDLLPFVSRDIPHLYNHLSGRLNHLYDLSNPIMNASIWALAQHHGYPTPLLDWTFSPFVAAYFAYQGVAPSEKSGSVRVFVLNKERWQAGSEPFYITHSFPMVSLFEPFSLENERSLPQQSIMMLSSVDDIEDHIRWHEHKEGKVYLHAIDLPISQRGQVLKELRLMGIGAGSLFPGIDGTCRDFKERYFLEF